MQILQGPFERFAFVAVAAAPLGIPTAPFWIYVCALLLLIAGLIKIPGELPHEHGLEKIMPFGRLFYAIPMAVFASEHFTLTASIAALVPRWIPAHTFWVYLVGVGFFCGAVSLVVLIQARLAAALFGMTLLIFVLTLDIPAVLAKPDNRFFWALALRELSFSAGAFAFSLSPRSVRGKQPSPAKPIARLVAFPRLLIGTAAVFYGVEHLLHPTYVPGVPLQKLTPEWIPGHVGLTYFVGVVLIIAGICLLLNRKACTAATLLGLTIFLAILWIYLPMLLRAPKDIVALNFFFDTLLFAGTILLLADALDDKPAAVRV